MKIEIIIYLIIAIVFCSLHRVIGGMKNGAFYAKGNFKYNIKLDKYIKNLHYLETPAWYTQFGSLFFLMLTVFRLVDYNQEVLIIIRQYAAAMIVTMGSSGLASYHYQGWINYGEGSPFYNPKEDKMSEFAFWNISFWWNRGWLDKYKKVIPFIGGVSILIGLYIGLWM